MAMNVDVFHMYVLVGIPGNFMFRDMSTFARGHPSKPRYYIYIYIS